VNKVVSLEGERFHTISIIEPEQKEQILEQQGLKELCSNVQIVFAKKGGREPGVHKWGR